MKLTKEEEHIRWNLSQACSYPRWKHFRATGGFLFWVKPNLWVEEAFKLPDGTWSIGSKDNGTYQVFTRLPDALNYGELLNLRREFDDIKSRFKPGDYAMYAGKLRLAVASIAIDTLPDDKTAQNPGCSGAALLLDDPILIGKVRRRLQKTGQASLSGGTARIPGTPLIA